MGNKSIKEIGFWKEMQTKSKGKEKSYSPDDNEAAVHKLVFRDFQIGLENINRVYPYYQSRSVIEEYTYNLHTLTMADDVQIDGEDYQTEWQTRFRRPLTRHKVIQSTAHVLSNPISPHTSPVNERKKDSRKKAEILNDLHKFARNDANYDSLYKKFIYEASISPAVIVKEGFMEKKRVVKVPSKDGYETKTILDKEMSGFQSEIIPLDSFFISNPNEESIQKQRFLITRKFIDIDQANGVYGGHKNFKFVRPGQYLNPHTDGGFSYDNTKSELSERKLVEEITYYSREKDMYVVFLNGVLVTEWDNAINREDKNYPFAKLIYEPIKTGFFYGFPLASKMAQDQGVLDQVYNMTFDAMKLDLFPPTLINQNIEEDINVPGSLIFVSTAELQVQRLREGNSGVQQAFLGINQIESQFQENSSSQRSGQAQPGERTGTEASILNANSQIVLNIFVGNIIEFVIDYGKLQKSTIKQHLLMRVVNDILSKEELQLYKDISIKNKKTNGKTFNQEIRFILPYVNNEAHNKSRISNLYQEEKRTGNRIVEVNPVALLDFGYDMIVDAEQVAADSDQLKVSKYIEFYDRAVNNPVFDNFEVSKNLAEVMFPGRSAEFLNKEEEVKRKVQELQEQESIPQVGGSGNFKEPKI